MAAAFPNDCKNIENAAVLAGLRENSVYLHMKRIILPLIVISFLLCSCSFNTDRMITVRLSEEHLWEYYEGKPMWYSLSYYDGESIKSVTLGTQTRSITLPVRNGKTCVFAAYPLDSLDPMGGVYTPGKSSEVSLSFKEGRIADLLLDVVRYSPSLVDSFYYEGFRKHITDDFDEDRLYQAFLDGTLSSSSVTKSKYFDVAVDNIPDGRYIGEMDWDPVFDYEHGKDITFSLIPGIHRFYNMQRKLVHVIALYSDGKTSYYNYILSGW